LEQNTEGKERALKILDPGPGGPNTRERGALLGELFT